MAPPKAGLIVTTAQSLPFSVIATFQAQYSLGSAVRVVTQAGQLGELLCNHKQRDMLEFVLQVSSLSHRSSLRLVASGK